MAMRTREILGVCALAVALAACGSETSPTDEDPGAPLQCQGADYTAFDAANHTNQDLRVGAYGQMMTLLNEAKADHTKAAANFAAAEALYQSTASLQSKVQGRTDDHLQNNPNVGADIDAIIMQAFADGKAASSNLQASLAKQAVDKTLVEFFFLSVYHEMLIGARKNWDEAFGYYGSGADNSDPKGFSAVADKRDGTNGTSLEQSIFNGIKSGSCELAKALEAEGVDTITVADHLQLWQLIDDTDTDMQKVLAFSVGHEAFDIVEVQTAAGSGSFSADQQETMWVKLAELEPYFRPLERILTAQGGTSKTRAEEIRAIIDTAISGIDDIHSGTAPDTTWMSSFDANGIMDRLEAEYGIDIQG